VPNTIELLFDLAAPLATALPVTVLFRSRAQGKPKRLQKPASNKRTCTRKLRPSVLKNGFSVTFHLKELLIDGAVSENAKHRIGNMYPVEKSTNIVNPINQR